MITLAPSATDRVLSITIPKAIDPYLVAYFNAEKLAGETINQFAVRSLKKLAFITYADGQVNTEQVPRSVARQLLQNEAEAFKLT